jgi:hypothetical protein
MPVICVCFAYNLLVYRKYVRVAACEPHGSHFSYFAKQAVNTAYRQPLIYKSSRLGEVCKSHYQINPITRLLGKS